MGYSPTEHAEFTEPPTEMSSHGFHRFTQILRVRCYPTEFTEFTEFGSVGMAGMPYPPTYYRSYIKINMNTSLYIIMYNLAKRPTTPRQDIYLICHLY